MSEQAIARPDETTAYLLFDRADDQAIIARIRGQALQAYVYSFRQDGTDIFGLGIDGAEACKRELARSGEVIEEEDIALIQEDEGAGYFSARASRWAVGKDGGRIKLDSAIGTKRQPKTIERRDGRQTPNPFWFEHGAAKSMRNAILRLVPEEIQQRVIAAYKANARKVQREEPGPPEGDGEASASETPRPITEPQQKRFWAIAREHKWSEEQIKDLLTSFRCNHTKEIVQTDYERIVERLKAGPPKPANGGPQGTLA